LASGSGKTFATLVREFLEEKIEEKKNRKRDTRKKDVISLLLKSAKKMEEWEEKGGVRDGSIKHDDYLYGKLR